MYEIFVTCMIVKWTFAAVYKKEYNSTWTKCLFITFTNCFFCMIINMWNPIYMLTLERLTGEGRICFIRNYLNRCWGWVTPPSPPHHLFVLSYLPLPPPPFHSVWERGRMRRQVTNTSFLLLVNALTAGMTCDVKAGRCQGSQYQLMLVSIRQSATSHGNSIQVHIHIWNEKLSNL